MEKARIIVGLPPASEAPTGTGASAAAAAVVDAAVPTAESSSV